MKRILLPTDFSINSLKAINYAQELFKNEAAEFYVLNVVKTSSFITDDLMTMTPSETLYKSLIDTSKKSINKIISKVKSKHKNNKHQFHAIVDYDSFIDAVNQQCASKKIELIIMGTKGITGLERILFGSNTVRVINRCSTPVLVIPSNYKFQPINEIVFTSNYATQYSFLELLPLLNVSKIFNSKIKIVHISDNDALTQEQENNKSFLNSHFNDVVHEFVDLKGINILAKVTDYLDKNSIQLLAMVNKKHSFFERLFGTHKIESFVLQIHSPILIMQNSSGTN
ncbi:universal stress protein [Yeosuana sp. MJ-SS3]|uniref:Universal stress protein n=1 Tax=Gilvirhabdus luticola TaxID=3079858 RepID=A0ABU3U7F5_9FLAO|nr:universal stress protein [Yeosuana sp. MJ-SS3]MDU8886339.1 universal stress protein [Yeosuana sp. MJ-SS3]